eukprot:4470459-Pyramimonas_sp.AAC.1
MLAAPRRQPRLGSGPISMCEGVASLDVSGSGMAWRRGVKRNARPALATSLGVRQGGVIHRKKGAV